MTILVGCSGWSYDDWTGRFYPHSLARKRGEWLAYYSRFFPTVEINSSFYQPPGERQVATWIKKGQALGTGKFEFSLKMPRTVTHICMVQKDAKEAASSARAFEQTCAAPLHQAGLLGSVLLQLSPYFTASPENLAVLREVLDALRPEEHSYAVEFRHNSWRDRVTGAIGQPVSRLLAEKGVAEVLTDGPTAPPHHAGTLQPGRYSSFADMASAGISAPPGSGQSAGHAYIRFHGRNCDLWFGREKEEGDFRLNRYDYLYSKEEIRDWVPRIKAEEIRADRVRIYFNNHARAKAVRNAFQLMDMLALPHEEKKIDLQNQYRLGGF